MNSKRLIAGFLAFLQLALSFSFPAYEAVAQAVVQARAVRPSISGVRPVSPLTFSPATSPRALNFKPTLSPAQNFIGLPISPAAHLLSESAAPAATEGQAAIAGPNAFLAEPARIGEILAASGLRPDAPADSSKQAAEETFAKLRAERIIARDAVAGAVTSGQIAVVKPLPASRPAATISQNEPPVPHITAPRRIFAAVAGAASITALIAAAPWLAAHVSLVAAAGSLILGGMGFPQIISNFRHGRDVVKDQSLNSTLIWFAGAALLSVRAFVPGSDLFWNLVNVLGVAQSATILGQINYFNGDSKTLKKTLLTAAAVAGPVLALSAFLPVTTLANVAFTAAMGLFFVVSLPQQRQNYKLYEAEGRAPSRKIATYPLLLIVGSMLHFFAAAVGQNVPWMINAGNAIVMPAVTVGQIFFPRATNALVGPAVRAADRIAEKLAYWRARLALLGVFAGEDLAAYQGHDAEGQLAELRRRAAALPGHSVIYL
jgi:hypothetical protein